jgi:uncharacterized membrane protein
MHRYDDLITGMILGAGTMYLLDPERGRRRRRRVRDQVVHGMHRAEDAAGTSSRDLANRARGLVAQVRGRVRSQPVEDAVLEARVRSRLGRIVSNAGAITVAADHGMITLRGPVLEKELAFLLSGVAGVRGVEEVRNRLETHARAGDVPGLQGQGTSPGTGIELLQENWAPGPRLLAGLAGGLLLGGGVMRGGISGTTLGLAGGAVLARSMTNLGLAKLVGLSPARRGIDIRKTVNLDAPVEEVFAFWSDFQNFPRFMSHLRKVTRVTDEISHWEARGPANLPVRWDAEIVAMTPNRHIAWRSVDGSPVRNAGSVHFGPSERGGCRVDIRMSYNPPAGALGHAVAALFGMDPKHAMDDDLVRLKSLLEYGKTTADGETVTRAEVDPGSGRRER